MKLLADARLYIVCKKERNLFVSLERDNENLEILIKRTIGEQKIYHA